MKTNKKQILNKETNHEVLQLPLPVGGKATAVEAHKQSKAANLGGDRDRSWGMDGFFATPFYKSITGDRQRECAGGEVYPSRDMCGAVNPILAGMGPYHRYRLGVDAGNACWLQAYI